MSSTMTDITQYIELQSKRVEQHLNTLVPTQEGPNKILFDAARYSLLGGGKRIRPILALAITEMLQGNVHQVLTPACALEIIHTYSLIHDDLPAMDNDDFRRGKPSLHKHFTEGIAILTGDYLLTYAIDLLVNENSLEPSVKLQLISTLVRQSGSQGMIGGQVMDLCSSEKAICLETLKNLHLQKTAALLTAAIEFGAIISKASAHQMNLLRQFGENIGLAFQIIDDILDVTSSFAKRGSDSISDQKNLKTTYVSLLGVQKAKDKADYHFQEAIQYLKQLPYETSLVENLANYMINRKH
ncbi:MAG: polyprenyl synthetase family protein [Parachlamydiaceae bacterium]|nr:polyprenyl synthetase family protein [Parachlamydiaceae bacterium]